MATGRELAIAAARNAGVPEDFFLRLVNAESGFNPSAVSPAGAFGLTQAMPQTWENPGFNIRPGGDKNDPMEQLRFGADYIRAMLDRYNGDQARAAAAYNWGPGNADKWDGDPNKLPAETASYIKKVAGNTIADNVGMNTLLEAGYSKNSNSPVTLPDVMDRQLDESKRSFHPSLALRSLGAAMAASANGQSAANDLTSIRDQYFSEREAMAQKRQDDQRRAAMIDMVGADSPFGQALAQGADVNAVMNAYTQAMAQAHNYNMQQQQQDFTRSENQIDRDIRAQELAQNTDIMMKQGQASKAVLVSTLNSTGNKEMADMISGLPDEAFSDPSMVRQLAGVIVNPAATDADKTAAIKEFEYRSRLDPEQQAAFDAMSRGRQQSINIDLGQKSQNISMEKRIEREQKELGMLNETINTHAPLLQSLDQMETILAQNPDLDTGMFYQYLAPVVEGMRMAGIAPEGWQVDFNDRASLQKLNDYMSKFMRQAGEGQTSDFDAQVNMRAAAGPNDTRPVLESRVNQMKDMILRENNRTVFLEDYVSKPKEDGTMPSLAEGKREWLKKVERGDPETMPLGHDFSKFTEENLRAIGPIKPGSWYRTPDGELLQATEESAPLINKALGF